MISYKLYTSTRFVISGNIHSRIVITDLHEDKSYEIMHSSLMKFRQYWHKTNTKKRDLFIMVTIASRKEINVPNVYEDVA